MNSSQNEATVEKKQHKKKLIILYCIGLILVTIGIVLIIVGAISTHKETSDSDSTSLLVTKTNTLEIDTQQSTKLEIIRPTNFHEMENLENWVDNSTTKSSNADDKIYFKK